MTLYKKNLKQLFPALFLMVTTLFYYIPSLVYFSNRKDFSDTFFVMILPVLAVVVIVTVIFWLILALIPNKIMKYFSAILLTAAVLLWLQGDYFVTNYGVLDGSKIYFEQFKQRGFYELAIVSVVFALSIFMQKFINKQLPFIVLLIAIGQIGIVTYNAINEANDKKTSKQIDDEFFNYSSKKNVILVILDAFGADYFEKIRQENPAVVDDLDGFVNYTDAISNYPVTHGSVPSLLTGKMVPDDVHYRHYLRHIVPKTDLPILLEKQGYLVSVISVYTWFDVLYKKMYLTEPVIDNAILKKYYALYLYDMAIFRAVPHFLKRFIYNNGSWRLSDTLANFSHIPSLRPEKARFMLDLVTNKMKKTTAQKRFKMVHVVLPHPEYVYDENCDKIGSILNIPETKLMLEQSKCAFKKLKQYLNKLKALNIYDSSLIVVVSDHGARVISDRSVNGFPSYFAMAGSAALFMVKGINQKGHFEDVDTPVSLIKLFDLFMDEKQHDKKIDYLKDNNRKFYAFNISNDIKNNYLPDAPLYTVGKNNRDPKSWKLEKLITHDCPLQKLPLKVNFKKSGREEYCAKFGFSYPDRNKKGTWTESHDIRIIFKLDLTNKEEDSLVNFKISFKPFLSGIHKQLELSWYINGHLLKTTNHNTAKNTEVDLQVPLSYLKEKELIEFKILTSKLYSPRDLNIKNIDSRKLGIFMQNIEIE